MFEKLYSYNYGQFAFIYLEEKNIIVDCHIHIYCMGNSRSTIYDAASLRMRPSKR